MAAHAQDAARVKYSIEQRYGYLHAEITQRESARDMKEFVLAVKSACLEHGCSRILMSVRESRTVFKAEEYGLAGDAPGYANEVATPSCRIALLGDSSELNHAHEYVELVARQQRVNLRAFRDRHAAVRWLQSSEDLVPDPAQGAEGKGRSGLKRP
jgi:hypothetical protein